MSSIDQSALTAYFDDSEEEDDGIKDQDDGIKDQDDGIQVDKKRPLEEDEDDDEIDDDDDNENDIDDDNDDDNDDDEPHQGRQNSIQKKQSDAQRKRQRLAAFVDDMAADDGGGDEEDSGDVGGDFVDADEGELGQFEQEVLARRAARQLQSNRDVDDKDLDAEVERIATNFDQKYAGYADYDDFDDGDDEDEDADDFVMQDVNQVQRQGLLPDVNTDPNMWQVRVKPGAEREVVVAIMAKCMALASAGTKPAVISALCQDHLKGVIYVEARKEAHVAEVLDGLRNTFYRRNLVPVDQMVSVLAVSKKGATLAKGDWVRITRGPYRGDIARVLHPNADELGNKVELRLAPRMRALTADTSKKGRSKERAPIRFFDPEEGRDAGNMRTVVDNYSSSGETLYLFKGNTYDKEGYLRKTVSIKTVEWHNVKPRLEEIQAYEQGAQDAKNRNLRDGVAADDDSLDDDSQDDGDGETAEERRVARQRRRELKAQEMQQKAIVESEQRDVRLLKGDRIKVIKGELTGVTGHVVTVTDDMVTIKPDIEELKDAGLLDLPLADVGKFFQTGDHVKVTGGEFEGDTGLVVRIDDMEGILTVFSDVAMKEFKVLARDAAVAADVATGKVALAGYEMYDMVQLEGSAVGVIVKIEHDSFRVLDTQNNVRKVTVQQMGQKRNRRHATSTDAHHNQIKLDDSVTVMEGPFKDRRGTIKHLYRYFAFIHSKQSIENNGILCVRVGQLYLQGGKSTRATAGGQFGAPMSPRHSGGMGGRMPGSGASFSSARGRNDLVGKTVHIIAGAWKGYRGTVKTATDTMCRVRLNSNAKMVNIARSMFRDDEEMRQARAGGFGQPVPGDIWDSRRMGTPSRDVGSQTPARMGTPHRASEDSADIWSANTPNTPHRASTPAGAYTPMTGHPMMPTPGTVGMPTGLPTPHTSAFDYSSTATPGTTYMSGATPSTAYIGGATPGTAYGGATPGTYIGGAATPATAYGVGATPNTAYVGQMTGQAGAYGTPGGMYTPATVSVPGGLPPMGGAAVVQQPLGPTWHLVGAFVGRQVGNEFQEVGSLLSFDVEADRATVLVNADSNETANYALSELGPVPLKVHSNVKFVMGEYMGQEGSLIGIDENDAIVKSSVDQDIRIVSTNFVVSVRRI